MVKMGWLVLIYVALEPHSGLYGNDGKNYKNGRCCFITKILTNKTMCKNVWMSHLAPWSTWWCWPSPSPPCAACPVSCTSPTCSPRCRRCGWPSWNGLSACPAARTSRAASFRTPRRAACSGACWAGSSSGSGSPRPPASRTLQRRRRRQAAAPRCAGAWSGTWKKRKWEYLVTIVLFLLRNFVEYRKTYLIKMLTEYSLKYLSNTFV